MNFAASRRQDPVAAACADAETKPAGRVNAARVTAECRSAARRGMEAAKLRTGWPSPDMDYFKELLSLIFAKAAGRLRARETCRKHSSS